MNMEKISQFVLCSWKQTFDKYNYIIGHIKIYIYEKYIKQLETQDYTLKEKCNLLRNIYYEIIKKYVTLYAKEELIIGLIAVKEFITKNITKLDYRLEYIYDERKCVNILINFVFALEQNEFKNYNIDKNYSYIDYIFIFGRQLTQLETNMERYKNIAGQKKVSLKDMAFDLVEDKVFHDYYEEYEKQGSYEKFEDYQIKNINIQKQTERLNVTPAQIRGYSNHIIQDIFGFTLNTLGKMSEMIIKNFFKTEKNFLLYIDDSIYCNKIGFSKNFFYMLGEKIDVTQDEINAILQAFSIKNKSVDGVELSCFYLSENVVYFGVCDMIYVFEIFEKFSLSGYFLEFYKQNIDFVKLLNPCQKRISTYMSYVLTDILVNEGYKMHIEKFKYNNQVYYSPCAEIRTISKGKVNILKNLGDIDILFLDEYKKRKRKKIDV